MNDYSEIVAKIKPSIAKISVWKGGSLKSQGSGFVFSKSGTLVTCNHVVPEPIDKIFVFFPDMNLGEFYEAKVITRDIKHDIAILEFADTNKRLPLELFNGEAKEGMPVIFTGYPLGLGNLITHHGILSSITKDSIGEETYFIDGTINQGNSGCPLLSANGQVLGVVTATHRRIEDKDLFDGVTKMQTGVISLYGVDLIEIHQSLIQNLQLGIGYAVPCAYIPKY